MSSELTPITIAARRLTEAGERLGWIFLNPGRFRREFGEPRPHGPAEVPVSSRLRRWALFSFAGALVLGGLVACCGFVTSEAPIGKPIMAFAGVVLVAGIIGGVVLLVAGGRDIEARKRLMQENLDRWLADHARFTQDQQAALSLLPDWSTATPSSADRRVDIIGGTPRGWEAVLTVYGSSLVGTRAPVTVVDFTGVGVCDELLHLTGVAGRQSRAVRFPSQLDRLDLTAGLEPGALVDSLVEAMHGDTQEGTRAERSEDGLLLHEICEVLGDNVTMARINAALRVITDRPGVSAVTPDEIDRLTDLFPDEARRQSHARVRRIEAFLRPLDTLGEAAGTPGEPALICLVADSGGHSARSDLLKDLVIQLLIRQVSRPQPPLRALILVGADDIGHRYIERLTDLCRRRGIRLVLFSAHLRAEVLQSLGGGEAGFMRMGNHQEALQAAEFIGRQYRFVMSSLTSTQGSDRGSSVSASVSDSLSDSVSHSVIETLAGFRDWSITTQRSESTNWSRATADQRVYEFAVEPRVLQELPEYAMLLVKDAGGRGPVLQAVECDPAIVTLPKVSMQPLPQFAVQIPLAPR